MENPTYNIWLGVWLLLIANSGLQRVWEERVLMLTGIILIGAALYKRYRHTVRTHPSDAAAENEGSQRLTR